MTQEVLRALTERMAPAAAYSFAPRPREEDGSVYEGVWDVTADGARYILKCAKEREAEVYRTFFTPPRSYAPALLGSTEWGGEEYLLLEYIAGENLQRCTRAKLDAAIGALALMQSDFWQTASPAEAGLNFAESFSQRKKRRDFLASALLEKHYDEYLGLYERLPRTLCHDDLLPFNVIVSAGRAVFIDWEAGGILPYPASLARLVAHGRSHGNLFRMTPDQRAYAVGRYYSGFAARHGIARADYGRALSYFLFSELCEWVFVGNRSGKEECPYYARYFRAANKMARMLEKGASVFI